MKTVDIGAEEFSAYADQDDADVYLTGSIHAGTTWDDATVANQGRALVTATRILDRQNWASGYQTQAERFAEADIVNASIEMAFALIDGSDLQTEQSTAQKLQAIKAGSVSLTYFRGAEGGAHRFPLIVHELLRDYLAGGGFSRTSKATGVSGKSSTKEDFGHTRGL